MIAGDMSMGKGHPVLLDRNRQGCTYISGHKPDGISDNGARIGTYRGEAQEERR